LFNKSTAFSSEAQKSLKPELPPLFYEFNHI
jgi:hypothetical protein